VLHIADGQRRVDDLHWGYRSPWGGAKGLGIASCARLEKIRNAYWGALLKSGRGIVAVDGWYEWTGPKSQRQPWHIHRRDGGPVFLAVLANFGPFHEHKAEAGFALVTADAEGGMVDVHDRRPVALEPADAARWLDPALPPEQAEHLLRTAALGPEAFAWFPVGAAVNRAGSEGPQLAQEQAAAQQEQPAQGQLC
jgi:putative SOS response-associated peptidase YedK